MRNSIAKFMNGYFPKKFNPKNELRKYQKNKPNPTAKIIPRIENNLCLPLPIKPNIPMRITPMNTKGSDNFGSDMNPSIAPIPNMDSAKDMMFAHVAIFSKMFILLVSERAVPVHLCGFYRPTSRLTR